jgi:hypothetical protein
MFSLLAKLGLDTVAFESGAKRAQSMATKLGGNLKDAITGKLGGNLKGAIAGQLGAALGVASVIGFAKSVINLADEIGDLSEQMNISTDDVQRLQVAAGETGVKFETISKGLVNLGQARLKAVEGAGKERMAFELLGMSLDEVNNANIDNIATAQKLQMAYEASGKSAGSQAAMIEIFGVKAFQAALALNGLKELGPISLISGDDLKKLGKINNELDSIMRKLEASAVPLLRPVVPVVEFTSDLVTTMQGIASLNAFNFESALTILDKIVGIDINVMGPLSRILNMRPFARDVGPMPNAEELIRSKEENTLGSTFQGPIPNEEELARSLKKPDIIKDISAMRSLGQGADSFAKIGLFGGFQSSQDRMIKELQTQANYLKYIQRASEKTADAVGQ